MLALKLLPSLFGGFLVFGFGRLVRFSSLLIVVPAPRGGVLAGARGVPGGGRALGS